jgi:hypothetical protein
MTFIGSPHGVICKRWKITIISQILLFRPLSKNRYATMRLFFTNFKRKAYTSLKKRERKQLQRLFLACVFIWFHAFRDFQRA